jgi:hypothetical protein
MAVAQLRVLGGAMARVPADATAFAHRGRRIMANVAALYERPEEAAVHEAWAAGFAAALSRGEPGVYVNFLGDSRRGRQLRRRGPVSVPVVPGRRDRGRDAIAARDA